MQGLVVGPQGSDGEDVGVREWDVEEAQRGGTVSGSGSSEPEIFVSSLPREPSKVPEAGLPIVDRLGTRVVGLDAKIRMSQACWRTQGPSGH